MSNALGIATRAYGAIGALFGLAFFAAPRQILETMQGATDLSDVAAATAMNFGAVLLPAGILLVAAGKDPSPTMARFAIGVALLSLAAAFYSGAVLFDDFGKAIVGLIIHGAFAAALITLYASRSGGRASVASAGSS
jgi:hypothetical protein